MENNDLVVSITSIQRPHDEVHGDWSSMSSGGQQQCVCSVPAGKDTVRCGGHDAFGCRRRRLGILKPRADLWTSTDENLLINAAVTHFTALSFYRHSLVLEAEKGAKRKFALKVSISNQ
jgi:hypothetical protein